MKIDVNDVGNGLSSMKKAVMQYDNMPMIRYDDENGGWHHIYNGIISPFATKYKVYIKSELKQRAQV